MVGVGSRCRSGSDAVSRVGRLNRLESLVRISKLLIIELMVLKFLHVTRVLALLDVVADVMAGVVMLPEISGLINLLPRVNHAITPWSSLQAQGASLVLILSLRASATPRSVGVGGVGRSRGPALLSELDGGGFESGLGSFNLWSERKPPNLV